MMEYGQRGGVFQMKNHFFPKGKYTTSQVAIHIERERENVVLPYPASDTFGHDAMHFLHKDILLLLVWSLSNFGNWMVNVNVY
jgi:hypothetical protein